MERRTVEQVLNQFELEQEVKKSIIDSFLSLHHQELQVEKDRADEANQTLAELQKNYDSAIKNSENLESLKSEITNLKSENKRQIANIESKYQAKLLDNAIELALTQAGARNNKAAAALIDKTDLKLSEDGSVLGLSELIESVKQDDSTSFLFNSESKEEKKVYNYIPQTDVKETNNDSMQSLFESQRNSNSQITGWE